MTDITPLLNDVLTQRKAPLISSLPVSLHHIDEFLKEAYRINAHIASLTSYLRSIRQAYLSTAARPRRHRGEPGAQGTTKRLEYLSDRERETIDAETKQVLRQLNASIRNLADAEQLRQNTETTLNRKKYGKSSLGLLGNWAAGGGAYTKSPEQEESEGRATAISAHRENVLWYLRRKLQESGSLQASMMEIRITREVEKNKSALHKSQALMASEIGGYGDSRPSTKMDPAVQIENEQRHAVEDELTPEQIQMFEKENQDMLKHYETALDQVKTAEKSLIEISELQTQLVNNLASQSEHIEQLVADSELTADNIGRGNQQLKKASERKSTARLVFYVSCGFSACLIIWDLLI